MQGYHVLAAALFLPALLLEARLLAVALAIAAAVFIAVEVLRIGQVSTPNWISLCCSQDRVPHDVRPEQGKAAHACAPAQERLCPKAFHLSTACTKHGVTP